VGSDWGRLVISFRSSLPEGDFIFSADVKEHCAMYRVIEKDGRDLKAL